MSNNSGKADEEGLENFRYVRRVALKVKQDSVGSFVSAFKNEVFPRTKKLKGVRRLYLLRSADSPNDYVSITFWNSEDDAKSYASSPAYSENSNQLRPLLESDPLLTEYHIEAHDINAEELPPPDASNVLANKSTGGKRSSSRSSRASKKKKGGRKSAKRKR
jgi:heme-degrading monooxygenase HmoA